MEVFYTTINRLRAKEVSRYYILAERVKPAHFPSLFLWQNVCSIARRTVPIRRGHLRPIMFRVNSQISRDKFALTSSLPPPSVVLSTCPPTTTMIKLKLLHAGRNVDSCRLNLQKLLQRSTFDVRRVSQTKSFEEIVDFCVTSRSARC